jgi:hypothetical protein
MTGIGGSLLFALANLFHPRMLWLMLWPVLALVAYVPLLGMFAPVVVGLTFIHYLLAQLKRLREQPVEGKVYQ